MSHTPTLDRPVDDVDLDAMFAALASEPRRAIIRHLATGGTTTPDLGARFAFSKQALNRHLATLEEAGLVHRRLVGRVHEVGLEPDRLTAVTSWAEQIREVWSANLDRLGAVLDELSPPPHDGDDDRHGRADEGGPR